MKRPPPRVRTPLALAALFLLGCAAKRVGGPPPPPAFDAAVQRPAAPAEAEAPRAAPAPSVAAPQVTPAPSASAPSAVPPTPAAPAPQASQGGAEDPPLGWIAGQPLEAEELLLEWGDVSSREFYLVLDKLVAARLALAEAGRLGIRLAPEAVDARYEGERTKLAEQVGKDGRGRSLEEYIERELGFEPKRYLERVRRATIRQMLAERAVRAASLASETVCLRLIVVPNDEKVESVRAALAAGREFADVAREFSVDDSKSEGGLVPFVVAQERSPLARLAFQTPVGETAGPLPISDHQFWIQIVERRSPQEGDWSGMEATIEASLARYPVGDAEFVHWKLQMEKRYPIDLGPLWSLIGAAR